MNPWLFRIFAQLTAQAEFDARVNPVLIPTQEERYDREKIKVFTPH